MGGKEKKKLKQKMTLKFLAKIKWINSFSFYKLYGWSSKRTDFLSGTNFKGNNFYL